MSTVAQQLFTQDFQVSRLSGALGAEVAGLDLSAPLTDAAFQRRREALQTYHLLCFRDQSDLNDEAQLAFTQRWGELEAFPAADKTKSASTIYNVANVSVDGEHLGPDDHRSIYQKVNARWHTGSAYRYIRSFASTMLDIEVLVEKAKGKEIELWNMLLAYALGPHMMAGE
jgi:alpha-ketoglutarate-dependent taurine dioxygenase